MTWSGLFGNSWGIAIANILIALALAFAAWREHARVERRRRADDIKFAVEIFTDLTSPAVADLLERNELTPVDQRNLASVRDRNGLLMNALSDDVRKRRDIVEPILKALDEVSDDAGPEGAAAEALGEAARKKLTGKSDTTKYRWSSGPPLPKWAMVNKIAHEFARRHNIDTVEDFNAKFGSEVRAAVGPELGHNLDESKLLIAEAELPVRAVKQTESFDRLKLDDTHYLVAWEVGLPNKAVGVRIHKPLIERFITVHGYPIGQA